MVVVVDVGVDRVGRTSLSAGLSRAPLRETDYRRLRKRQLLAQGRASNESVAFCHPQHLTLPLSFIC